MKQYYPTTRRIILFFLFILLAIANHSALADSKTEQDESLRAYFNNSASKLNSPEVLKMSDTLYHRAQAKNNKYYQVLARTLVLDYYYFQKNKEKVLQHVAEIKELSRSYNELDIYYFVWGSRLIAFYLKNGMPNHALLEAQKMLREAQEEHYQPGIAECYKAMANIHLLQSNQEQAAQCFTKLIELTEKIKPDDVNLPVYYIALIESLMPTEHIKEVEKALQNAQAYFDKAGNTITPYQETCLIRSYLYYYLYMKEYDKAQKKLAKLEKLFASSKELDIVSTYLYDSQLRYYMGVKEYEKALAITDTIWSHNPTYETKTIIYNKKGDIYWALNNRAAAAECYREYIHADDSIRKASMQRSADEIAGLLNLRQLEQEKQHLIIDIQNRRLTTTYWAIGALVLILAIATIVIIHIYRLNRQLKESKQVVIRQNDELRQSGEKLKIAKDQAEEASRMKTHFIQNITHEVRTPLNSIVGFSQVLVEFYKEPETEEYASLITVNSNYLLRLFNDILELSNIDQIDSIPLDTVDNINAGCQNAISEARSFAKEGQEIIFHPAAEDVRIKTSPSNVAQILNNLLHNATKFTEAGSIILETSVAPSEGVIRYTVTDTGNGIPTDKQEMVFERFKKLDYFTQGSGLGLSVSRAVATKLGGTLTIDPEYTSGCRFVLTLPYVPE